MEERGSSVGSRTLGWPDGGQGFGSSGRMSEGSGAVARAWTPGSDPAPPQTGCGVAGLGFSHPQLSASHLEAGGQMRVGGTEVSIRCANTAKCHA